MLLSARGSPDLRVLGPPEGSSDHTHWAEAISRPFRVCYGGMNSYCDQITEQEICSHRLGNTAFTISKQAGHVRCLLSASMNLTSIRLVQGERGLGFGASAVAAFSFLTLWVPNLGHSGGHVTGGAYLAIGLILAGAILAATFTGRLVLLSAVMAFTCVGPWGPEHLFQVLFMIATAWLVFRLVRTSIGLRASRSCDRG